MSLDFLRIFDNPLSNNLIFKEFLECIRYILGYLPKSISGLGPAFGVYFSLNFFFYIVLYRN